MVNSPIEKHRMVASGIVGLPYDFRLSTLAQWGSGVPFSRIDETAGGARPRRTSWYSRRTGDRFRQVDLRLQKSFNLPRPGAGRAVAEAINVFDHANYRNYQQFERWGDGAATRTSASRTSGRPIRAAASSSAWTSASSAVRRAPCGRRRPHGSLSPATGAPCDDSLLLAWHSCSPSDLRRLHRTGPTSPRRSRVPRRSAAAHVRLLLGDDEPANGLVPDRWPTESFSSVAAVGFGLPAYAVGIERGWITRDQAADRVLTTLRFLLACAAGPGPPA
jgi:hypothetical protein